MTMSQRMWIREQERRKRERERRARRRRNCAIAVFVLALIAVISIVLLMSGNKDEKVADTDASSSYTQAPEIDKTVASNSYTTTREIEDIKLSFYNESAFAGNALAETIGMYGILERTDFYSDVNADVTNVYTIKTLGSTTSIAEQFKSKNFKKIFLCFGEKELAKGNSAEFKSDYRAFINKIKEYQPNVSIYLVSIPPVTHQASDMNENGITMSRIKSYNKQIKTLAVEEDVYYIDSVDALGDNKGFLPSGVSNDGINLNKAAVIDLLYYAAKEAYIPTRDELTKDDEEDIEEEESTEENEESATSSASAPEPQATVNILKDSEIKKADKETE